MFKKAERYLTNPTIAFTGPTGSGKTFSALRFASGVAKKMGGKFAVVDAENGSASLYSEFFDFDTLNLSPPFTTEKYIEAIMEAEKQKYVALVVDTITHAWAGEGGLLEQKGQLDARPGSNHWTNWNPIKAKDQKFRNCYLHSSIPFLIATMRSKMEYAQTENAGKKKIEKIGMAPIQSDGIEYEFSVVFDLAMNHEAEVSKDRTHLFDKAPIFTITEETGERLVAWRNSGKTTEAQTTTATEKKDNGVTLNERRTKDTGTSPIPEEAHRGPLNISQSVDHEIGSLTPEEEAFAKSKKTGSITASALAEVIERRRALRAKYPDLDPNTTPQEVYENREKEERQMNEAKDLASKTSSSMARGIKITFGKKFNGKTVGEAIDAFGIKDVKDWRDYLLNASAKENKPLGKAAQTVIDAISEVEQDMLGNELPF